MADEQEPPLQPRTQVTCWRDTPLPLMLCAPCACTSAARSCSLPLPRPSRHALRLRVRLGFGDDLHFSRPHCARASAWLRGAPGFPREWFAQPSLCARALPPRRDRACFPRGAKPSPQASLLLNAGGMCTCPMPSCDLERSAFQNPPGPGVSDEELQLGVNCTGVATLEGLTETSDVQKLSRACLYSGVRCVGSEEHAGVRAQTQGRVLLQTICAAGIGGTFQFGYNLSIINAPTVHIQEFTNQTWQARTGQPLPDHLILIMWSLIVSLYPLGGLFGALLAGPLAVMLGRKKSLLVNNVFVVAAAILFGFSHRAGSFEMIMLGRLLVGVSAGVSMSIQPMYLGESAPKEFRGAVAMTSAIFTALGIVMGQVVGLRELLGGRQAWPLLLASCLVPGVLQLASLPLLPESPRYLLIDRGDTEACLAALQRLRGTADLASELAELEEERAACQGLRAWRPWELFQDRTLRRQVVSLVVLGSAMELCGNDSMYAYASSVFGEAGVPQEKVQYAIIGTGCCELLTACISCMVIERVGRRVLLIGGYCLMTCWGSIFTVALCLQSSFPWMPYLAMSCIFAFILSFGIGPAGVTGILATELFDQMARPAAYMVCGALMWTMLFLVGLGFPFIMEALSYFLYVPFLVVCVCGATYTGFFLPETKGKTFLEISEELHRLNFPRRSQGPTWRGPKVTQSTEL